jgi:hypothetical protein
MSVVLTCAGDVSSTQHPARGHSPIAPMSLRLMELGPVSIPDSWEHRPLDPMVCRAAPRSVPLALGRVPLALGTDARGLRVAS